MLSDRCLSCLSVCLSVTLAYCGQTAGWIRIGLGTEVGLGPGDTVVWGLSCPPRKNVSEMTYFVSSGTQSLKPLTQSITQRNVTKKALTVQLTW